MPVVKKLSEKILKVNVKDYNEVLDGNWPFKLKYQLRVISEVKNMKHSQLMLEKGFIDHISKIFLNKRFHTPEGYLILTSLMGYFNELLKFIKMAKNVQTFNENYLISLLHYNSRESKEYIGYMTKCFLMVKDIAYNKEFMAHSKLKVSTVF